MKAAMSDDGGDSVEEQIQAHYQKFQREPGNPKHALAIASLYEKRKEYANAVPWFQHAFDVSGRVDSSLERRILDLSIQAGKDEITDLQAAVDAEKTPADKVDYQKAMDKKLDELNRLLKVRKQRRFGVD
jgi:hypothetical protein